MKFFLYRALFFSYILFGLAYFSVDAADPVSCLAPTTVNVGSDSSCNTSGTSTDCLQYCSGTTPGFSSSASGTGLLVAYHTYSGANISVAGSTINQVVTCASQFCDGILEDPNFSLSSGSSVSLYSTDGTGNGIGWRGSSGNICGEAIPATNGEGTYDQFDISSAISRIPTGYTIISTQCWGDHSVGDSDFDFNDMWYVVAIKNPVISPPPGTTKPPLPKTDFDTGFLELLFGITVLGLGLGTYTYVKFNQSKAAH